jgi:FkbM family methyltransferase
VVDLGANVGFFLLRFLDLARSAGWRGNLEGFAVEGVPETFSKLRHRLTGYPELEGLECIQGLVGKRSGAAYIGIGENPLAAAAGKKLPGTEQVRYVDVQQRLERLGELDLLKCDIEGSEGDVLDGYPDLLRMSRVLIIEFHPLLCDPRTLEERISAAGLELIAERAGFEATRTCIYARGGANNGSV